MERCRFGSSIGRRHPDQDVFGIGFGVFNGDVEVAILFEDACVDELEFRLRTISLPVFLAKRFVGKAALGIFVKRFGIAAGGRPGQVKHVVLEIFAVIAFRIA